MFIARPMIRSKVDYNERPEGDPCIDVLDNGDVYSLYYLEGQDTWIMYEHGHDRGLRHHVQLDDPFKRG